MGDIRFESVSYIEPVRNLIDRSHRRYVELSRVPRRDAVPAVSMVDFSNSR